MALRVRAAFDRVLSIGSGRFPDLIPSTVTLHVGCPEAERDHRKLWRQFAHANHHPNGICFARAAELELTDRELMGMMAHEFGHVIGDALGYSGEKAADDVAREILGLSVKYNARTLQELEGPTRGRRSRCTPARGV